MKSKDYFKDEWMNYFDLSETSKTGLVWKVDRGNGKSFRGSPAGYASSSGHWKVELNGKTIPVHRIVYFLHNREIPDNMVVDHKDQNPANNSVDNLRLVTFAVNMRNKKLSKSSRTMKTGVHERHEFVASWVENGKLRSKAFRVSEYGNDTFRVASEYRDEQIQRLNDMGYKYTDIHGT